MSVYYNENDPQAAAWLRALIVTGQIAPGDVDERSIEDVRPDELERYTQCHFFAGIGGWSYALRLAGWSDDRPVWTGSCPCQPFSAAGNRRGTNDARHLWPHWRWLISQCGPAVVFGEQVASKDGRGWLAGVRSDLETLGYGVGAADLCAAGAGAPHIRQRLWWVADPDIGFEELERGSSGAICEGRERDTRVGFGRRSTTSRMGDAEQLRSQGLAGHGDHGGKSEQETRRPGYATAWSDFDLIGCADGKARRIEPSSFPLAHGVPARVGRLRGYGNAIVPQVAAAFIEAYLDVRS